ncbi:hypothetical protein BJV78DRAFT_1199477 [Lactifluus subvellereus]|nr:hypothetical protein BJV78DRAFT_1199477 [Lactifluus subvellereus]
MLECNVVVVARAKGNVHQVRIKRVALPEVSIKIILMKGSFIKEERRNMKVRMMLMVGSLSPSTGTPQGKLVIAHPAETASADNEHGTVTIPNGGHFYG